ncbi:3-oxoacyl-[acyl-carrier-protein] synthase II [Streptomyces sp. 2224.1]|uniref:beta-ketoacyl-[acyl-carrier-protein] synthase family protein n=1 Tax=unclassified Streptomyces TaxID=2593676 RepID=UPI0008822900|nr:MULTISPECIES: beta-ketoacyl-[acyl-carrier-protein] synthase family protein [unclassified Streptomyces]PBC86877.1 3-oxoacyl-[acyl-carrier-protein] synthase II [Streptomyces sp. 2321.6]SDQ69417.1 3-oxoacyl-[acyl-carrier-protein] synthase II [Streptomyces sp. KS_16]SED39587.1 3-oxoacyl-[acyl-carrier-protein] synthase II [Streptomyces sp. 2112.3]SED79227.1 3-oxoacyl-[acyl-carrier-protein] synthase II [Streptomyces sp. 2224.1]SEE12236.1 3-oxoacyl-[acyl-carrier-protein] synthase II [Streptomyces 
MPGQCREVAVTGLGVITPAGIGARATWDGLLTGRSTAARDPELAGLPVDISCRVPDFDTAALVGRKTAWRLDRFVAMAVLAARHAVADAGLGGPADRDPARIGVVMGTGTGSMERYVGEFAKLAAGRPLDISPLAITRSVPNMAAAEIALDLAVTGPNFAVSTACASGSSALGIARDLLRAGTCDIVLAGGAESARHAIPAACFHRMGALSRRSEDPAGACRPFDARRDGFVLSEGAAVLVLERPAHAQARGARPRAQLAGYGASCDAYHYAAPDPDGRGAAAALTAALADAGAAPGDIDHINAHGTGTRRNDLAEAKALRSVFPEPPAVTSLKGALGHAIGAAGAIEAAVTVLSLQRDTIPPTANHEDTDLAIDLDIVAKVPRTTAQSAAASLSMGFGGQNAALVFRSA